ncbi:uncharacterized protein LOC136029437 isoform X6 [Artemia franciscana]|uniref:uncharacterized protein LOC136029437 isoform X6 n=1 Tax=Artemia franciscana TaxID=6661 RepID=UPI0032DA03C0
MDPSLFSTDRFSSPPRVLEIIKDSKGFGFVVAGDKPVFVQSVREGGAAERAGLMKNDVIIKVNGVNVTDFNHAEVVNLIKAAGPFVTLTLIGQNSSSSFNGYSPSSPTSMPLSPVNLTPSIQGPDIPKDRLISLPKPVDNEQQRALDMSAVRTLQTMYEREEEARNRLRAQQERHPNPRTAVELAQSEEILKELRRKISAISGTRDWIPSSVPSSVLNVTARSPPAKRSLANFGSRKTDMGSLESEEESPPPLPVRVTSRMSNPLASPVLSPINSERRFGSPDIAPPLPPRNNVMMRSHEDGVGTQHQRTKSSPFPYRGPEVIPDLRRMSTVDSGDLETHKAQRTTSPVPVSPAGSPPPPYSIDQPDVGGRRSHGVTFSSEAGVGTQWQIPSMEDDDWSDHESSVIEDHGPYTKISTLLEAKPYLAVFINYLLCNYDPSNLFFLLITDHYKEGTSTKDMCRWAFEINTTFLVPNAPLKVQSVDEQILREIDDVLTNFASKEERLRTVFFKARKRASGAVKMELDDFRNKRQAGLAGLFGPSDEDLKEASVDLNKEIKVVETLLLPKLQEYSEEIDGCLDDRSLACASALATILSKVFNLKSQAAVCLLEKCPTFVTREKSLKTNKLLNKTKKSVSVRGHDFALLNYMSIVECIQCGNILWGVSPQGYQCKNCKINFHKLCLRQFESGGAVEPCVGAPPLKKQAPFKWVPQIRKTTIASNGLSSESFTSPTNEDIQAIGERSGSVQPSSLINGKSEQIKLKRDGSFKDSERPEVLSSSHAPLPENQDEPSQKLPKSDSRRQRSGVGRSDSLREPTRKAAISREHRKRSDPNLPPSSNHEEMASPVVFAHSGSSSNSSLSTRSLESPGPSDSRISNSVQSDSSSSVVPWGDDSDLEADTETPDWTKMVESDILRKLSHKEKQRQEVINELFHTERSHVRCLKVLDRVFCRPLTESNLIPDILNLLFANLNEMIEIHARFNTFMKHKRKSKGVIDNVGDILLCMFDGQEGERLQRAASQFCQHQSFALEALKERRKKETKLDKFLYDAEMNPVCRRLQLKDLLPTGMQRLTKYPLLLESLLRHTPVKHADHQPIKIALEKSRALLKVVNASIHEAENQHRLAELQKRLDKSSGDKSDHELRNFDLTRRRLVHEGPLTWRCKDRRPIDLHVLVLEDSIVLLQKDDNKYVLKYHTVSSTSGSEPVRCSPIIKYTSILLKPDARDSTAFYLIDQPTTSPQMYEMVSSSTSERKAWLKHITEATESYMNREGRKRPESTVTLINLPAQTSSSSLISEQDRSNSDESNEVPVEKTSADSGVGLNIVSQDSLCTSEIKPEPEQQMSADSAVVLLSPELLKPGGEDLSSSVSRSASTVSTSQNPSRRRFQRVEILQIAEGTPLIQPTEVKVSQGDVHTAEPVLTPLEKLRRKDQLIRAALVEKQRLVAEVLHVSPDELDSLVQLDSTPLKGANQEAQEARDLVLAAIMQASKLTTVLNDSLRITEEEAIAASSEPTSSREPVLIRPLIEHVHPTRECDPISRHESFHLRESHKPVSPRTLRKIMKLPSLASHRLVPIVTSLNSQLTQLMAVINEKDVEFEKMKKEMQRLREQLSIKDLKDTVETCLPSLVCESLEEESDIEEEVSAPQKGDESDDVGVELVELLESEIPSDPCLERLKSESPPRSRPLSVVSLESVGDGIYVAIRESAYIDRPVSEQPSTEVTTATATVTTDLIDKNAASQNLEKPCTDLELSKVVSVVEEEIVDKPLVDGDEAKSSKNVPDIETIKQESNNGSEVNATLSSEESLLLPEDDVPDKEVVKDEPPIAQVVKDDLSAPEVAKDDSSVAQVVKSDISVAQVSLNESPVLSVINESSSSNSSDTPLLIEDFGTASDSQDEAVETVEAVNDSVAKTTKDPIMLETGLPTASEA